MNSQQTVFDPLALGSRAERERLKQGLTIAQLAAKARVNKNTVVRFEKGRSTHFQTIYKICEALNVSPLKLIETELNEGQDYKIIEHIPIDSREVIEQQGVVVRDFKGKIPGGSINACVLEISGHSEQRSHIGEELLFCLAGRVGVIINTTDIEIKRGDAVLFWGTEPHIYYNADVKRIELNCQSDLDNGKIPDGLRPALKKNGLSLSQNATVSIKESGKKWVITDEVHQRTYAVNSTESGLNICDQEKEVAVALTVWIDPHA